MILTTALWIFIPAIELHICAVESHRRLEAARDPLELGRKYLASGQFANALKYLNAAVENNPNNYVVYHERATVYLALAKSKSAVADLNKVLKLKPDFTLGRLQRASVLLKQGRLDEAHIDFEAVLRKQPHNAEALLNYNAITTIARDIQNAQRLLDQRFYNSAVNELSQLIEKCPWDPKLREMRAEGYIQLDEFTKAISDMKVTTKLLSSNTEAYFKLSNLHYQLGEGEEALTQIRECLKLDPEDKICFPFYKQVKNITDQIKSLRKLVGKSWYKTCTAKANQMLQMESHVEGFIFIAKAYMCHCLTKAEKAVAAIPTCTEALKIQESAPVYCDRAEAYILLEQFDNASTDYQSALNVDERSIRAEDGRQRLPKLIKQSNTTDLYEILQVKRTAGKQDILKAYRKLAQRWHPDNFQDADMKQKAHQKFININDAKDVLIDPEKREKYDHPSDL